MKATSITRHEASFDKTGIDALGKKFVLKPEIVKIKGTTEKLTIVDCKRDNQSTAYYFKEVTEKKKIILHYTMGYLKGDIATLTNDHVSVAFVIGRNGSIYNLFDSKYWSFHLGPNAIGGNTEMSKQCIGIEISNIGPLKKIGKNLVTTYSDTDVYCTIDETQYYTALPSKYRGFDYYAKFTENQYTAVSQLLKFLCGKYNIPATFIDENQRYELLSKNKFVNFTGIASHVNCRTDKTDIGPAFDWKKITDGIL